MTPSSDGKGLARPVPNRNGRWDAHIDGVEYPVAQDFKHQEDIEFHCEQINAAHESRVRGLVEALEELRDHWDDSYGPENAEIARKALEAFREGH